ncbi:hypothetical protein [Paenibacillus guangzhouensis]|uniref:hypothetical protein n=1 Tax=Paenibacillus guangzhouensis TaxID=1473112 RepID=UPI0012671363|nr:hypothetical protein [Paenibacillus guangzhouensis]
MSLFDKMKSGLNQVKDKAQQTVEYTKLYAQIASKRKDIQEQYEQLGEIVYRASGMSTIASTSMDDVEGRMKGICREISVLETQLIALEQELARVKGERICSCGETSPYDSKFCSRCGKPFADEVIVSQAPIDLTSSPEAKAQAENEQAPTNAEEPGQSTPNRGGER